jgi:uncharacterized protein YjiS (DUF1127 family)
MSYSIQTSERPGPVGRLARWWRNWNRRRRKIAELDCCGPAEAERIARDLGVSRADLCVLAGKWPDASDLLYARMNEINLDRKEITQVEPEVMRDLQRVCTVCGSKRRCEHKLARNPSDPAWQKYCPNATTLLALAADRAAKARAN